MNFDLQQEFDEEKMFQAGVAGLTVRRFLEMLFWSVFLSAFGILFNFSGIAGSKKMLMVFLTLGTLAYLLLNLHQLKQCFYDLQDKKMYYYSNFIAYFLFVIVSLLVYVLAGNTAYAWCFAITKFLRYSPLGISNLVSALIFHGLLLLVIIIAPIGMDWIFMEEEEQHD